MGNDTNEQVNEQEIEHAAETEIKQIALYKEIYRGTHQYPQMSLVEAELVEKPDPRMYSFMALEGIEATLSIATTLGAVVYASFRTIIVFVGSEQAAIQKQNLDAYFPGITFWIAIISALGIMLGIEGYLAIEGLKKGKASKQENVSPWVRNICIAISSLTGAALYLDQLTDPFGQAIHGWVIFFLILIAGPGVPIIIYFGTYNIGVLYNRWKAEVKIILDEYKVRLDKSKEKYDEDLKIAKQLHEQAIRVWEEEFEKDYRQKGRQLIFGKGKYNIARDKPAEEPAPIIQRQAMSDAQRVRKWLMDNNTRAEDVGNHGIVRPEHIAKQLPGITPGNVGTILHRIREDNRKQITN